MGDSVGDPVRCGCRGAPEEPGGRRGLRGAEGEHSEAGAAGESGEVGPRGVCEAQGGLDGGLAAAAAARCGLAAFPRRPGSGEELGGEAAELLEGPGLREAVDLGPGAAEEYPGGAVGV